MSGEVYIPDDETGANFVYCSICGHPGETGHYGGCLQTRWDERCGDCLHLPEEGHRPGCSNRGKVSR